MANSQRLLNRQAVASIMNQRTAVPAEAFDSGNDIKLRVQGDGNVQFAKDKDGNIVNSAADPNLALEKKIFNFQATAAPSITNPRNRQYMLDGIAAEKAGDLEKADELYRDFLNATQISVGILLPSKIAEQLRDKMLVTVVPVTVTTDKGTLYTVDPKNIGIVEAKTYGSVKFDMSMFDGDEEDEEEEEAEAEVEVEAPKATGKPAGKKATAPTA